MKRYFLPVIAFLMLVACEKEPVYEDFQSETLIRQIKATETDMQVFTYYSPGYIFEHLTRFTYRKYLYHDNNQLKKIEISMSLNPLSCAIIPGTDFEEGDDPRQAKVGQFIEFDYTDNGKLTTSRHYFIEDGVEQLMNYEVFEYQDNNVIRKDVYNPNDQLTHYYTYQYDSLGNVEQEDYYAVQDDQAVLQSRILSEFDNMHNPLQVFAPEGTPGTNTNANNIVRQTTQYFYNGTEEPSVIAFDYEYNDLGYPIHSNSLEYVYGVGE
jgi:hypothetical protein